MASRASRSWRSSRVQTTLSAGSSGCPRSHRSRRAPAPDGVISSNHGPTASSLTRKTRDLCRCPREPTGQRRATGGHVDLHRHTVSAPQPSGQNNPATTREQWHLGPIPPDDRSRGLIARRASRSRGTPRVSATGSNIACWLRRSRGMACGFVNDARGPGSRDADFSDLGGCRALGDEEGQELERVFGARGGDEPPDHVAAEEA